MSESSTSRFSLIDLLAVLFLVGVGAAGVMVFVSAVNSPRSRHGWSPQMQNNTQVRGIHQAMVMYAQSNGTYYPGLDTTGAIVDATVEYRFKVLLDANFFAGDYIISPSETKTEWTTGPVTSDNYSYAMLDIDAGGERIAEWTDTINSEAVVLSDRNTGSDAQANVQSVHTVLGDWRGSVAWNDNHVIFSTTHLVDTNYGAGPLIVDDNLFEAAGTDDAYMIYSGQ